MPSEHPRIALTRDPELADAIDRVRAVTGSDERTATLVRGLALRGAETVARECAERHANATRLLGMIEAGRLQIDVAEIDAAQMRTAA